MIVASGCSTTIVPPSAPEDPVIVAVTDYGRHSSLVLPDAAGRGSIEYAFGDWGWFAAGRNSALDGVAALLWSPRATLGRRPVDVATDSPQLAYLLDASTLLRFEVPRRRVADLRNKIEATYRLRARTALYNPAMELHFVHDDARYRLWHNCNHVTAEWVRALGCEIDGAAYTSKFKLERRQ